MKQFAQRNTAALSRDDWETPPDLFARYDARFHFTLDAAASPVNAKCARYFTKADDALRQDWGRETVWLNPPYGKDVTPLWIHKANWAALNGATVACLVPVRSDAGWWHDYVEPVRRRSADDIDFIKGRVKFVGAPYNAPFPCCVVVFRPLAASRT